MYCDLHMSFGSDMISKHQNTVLWVNTASSLEVLQFQSQAMMCFHRLRTHLATVVEVPLKKSCSNWLWTAFELYPNMLVLPNAFLIYLQNLFLLS